MIFFNLGPVSNTQIYAPTMQLQREGVYRTITYHMPIGLQCKDITNGLHVISLERWSGLD